MSNAESFVQLKKAWPCVGTAVSFTRVPLSYSVVLPVLTISSVTVPSPVTFTESWYFFFSKFAVISWFELTLIVKGLSVDSVPVHPTKRYSESGVAVIVTVDPDSKDPPELLTLPPSPASISILNKTTGASVSSSNASRVHVIKINNVKR